MHQIYQEIQKALVAICGHYEKTAPTVADWADDLYIRMNEEPDSVRLTELNVAVDLAALDLQPNYAANRVYKLMSRLGMDTTGHAGF